MSAQQRAKWPRTMIGPASAGRMATAFRQARYAAPVERHREHCLEDRAAGAGTSSPITFRDRIYITCYSGYGQSRESRGRLEDLRRHLVCLSRQDGRILWDKPFASMVPEHPYGDYVNQHGYASSTPAADETGVYTFFGVWGARAYDHDGTLKWERSCGTRYTNYGSAASPVLVGDLVVINAAQESQAIVALDKKRPGSLASAAPGSYSTPLVVKTEQGHELVLLLPLGEASNEDNRPPPGGLVAVDPRNGNKLWQCISVNANFHASPIASEGIIYAVANRPVAIRAGGRGDVTDSHLVWQVNQGSEAAFPDLPRGPSLLGRRGWNRSLHRRERRRRRLQGTIEALGGTDLCLGCPGRRKDLLR